MVTARNSPARPGLGVGEALGVVGRGPALAPHPRNPLARGLWPRKPRGSSPPPAGQRLTGPGLNLSQVRVCVFLYFVTESRA